MPRAFRPVTTGITGWKARGTFALSDCVIRFIDSTPFGAFRGN